jgi:V8-like Glu-specific endopeptidase
MRSAKRHSPRSRHRRHSTWTKSVGGTYRAHRAASITCAAVLVAAGAGVTAYANADPHPGHAAAGPTLPPAMPPITAGEPKPTPTADQFALPMQSSTKVESTGSPGPTSDAMKVSDPLAGKAFSGVSQIGTLFKTSNGALTSHHCTGSVVTSPEGDIVVTAAHCVYDSSGAETSLVFVPEYDDGSMPYGTWDVSAVYVDPHWAADRDPDYDVAFIVVHKSGSSERIQDEVGSDPLAVNRPYAQLTTVIGYPSDTNAPITCTNYTTEFSSTQLRFDCADYPGGTSGSPFLTDVDTKTGFGTVVGVLGGYETGGDTSSVSYAVHFDDAIASLFAEAQKAG